MAINSFSEEYDFLSNAYPVRIELCGYEFRCVEAAYQAAKEAWGSGRKDVMSAFTKDSASEAKLRGTGDKEKKLERDAELVVLERPSLWESPYWDTQVTKRPSSQLRVTIMAMLLDRKFFAEDERLLKQLVATGDVQLINGDCTDTFWGAYKSAGENMLGKLLMELRNKTRNRYVNQ